jgi:hypothetical protein
MPIDLPENTVAREAAEVMSISGQAEFVLDMETPDLGERVSEALVAAGRSMGVLNSQVIGVYPQCKLKIITSFQEMGTVSDFIQKIKEIIVRCKEAMMREAGKYRERIVDSIAPKGSDPAPAI